MLIEESEHLFKVFLPQRAVTELNWVGKLSKRELAFEGTKIVTFDNLARLLGVFSILITGSFSDLPNLLDLRC